MTERVTQRRGQVLTDHILRTAYDFLVERPYGDFTIDLVAEWAGVSKASIYSRWPNKYALVIDAVSDRVPYIDIPDLGSFEAEIRHLLLARLVDFGTENTARIIGAQLAAASEDPVSGASLAESTVVKQTALDRVIERGIARGEVDPDISSETVKHLIPSALVFRSLFLRSAPTEEFVGEVASIIARGVAPLPPKDPVT